MRTKYIRFLFSLILVFVCTISIGYSAFGSEMAISNIVADIRIASDVRITNVGFVSADNGSVSNLNYDVDSVLGDITLKGANSTVTIEVSVTNFGNTEMGIYAINGLSENLVKQVSNYELGDKLCDSTGKCDLGSTSKFNITIGYDTYDAVTKDHELRLDFEFRKMYHITYTGFSDSSYPISVIDGGELSFVAPSNTVPKIVAFKSTGERYDSNLYSYVNGTFNFYNVTGDINLKYQEKVYLKTLTAGTDFKESNYKTEIDSIQFVDYVDISNAVKIYDLSDTSGSQEIIGWVTSDDDLYIGSEFNIYTKNLSSAFEGMSNVESIVFNNLNTSEATTMYSMFKDCVSLNSVNVGEFDTGSVTSMANMFYKTGYNSTILELDVSKFNTKNVINMSNMFSQTGYNSTILNLDVSNFDTSKVTNMANMFASAGYKSTVFGLNVSNFNTSNVTNMSAMFQNSGYSNSDFTLDVSGFDTSNVTDFSYMFHQTGYINSKFTLDVSGFNTSSATNMNNMFRIAGQNSSVIHLDVSNFDTSKVTNMAGMFMWVGNKNPNFTLDVSGFDTSNVTTMSEMFNNTGYSSTKLFLDVSKFNTSKVTNMLNMFAGAGYKSTVFQLDLSNFDTSKVTNMGSMFLSVGRSNPNFTIDVSSFNTSKVTNMQNMFRECGFSSTNFTLDVSNFNTSNVTNMSAMFYYSGYTNPNFTLNLGTFDTSKASIVNSMFVGCGYNSKKMNVTITMSNPNVTNYSDIFKNVGLFDGTSVKVNYTEDTSDLVDLMIATRSENSYIEKGDLV